MSRPEDIVKELYKNFSSILTKEHYICDGYAYNYDREMYSHNQYGYLLEIKLNDEDTLPALYCIPPEYIESIVTFLWNSSLQFAKIPISNLTQIYPIKPNYNTVCVTDNGQYHLRAILESVVSNDGYGMVNYFEFESPRTVSFRTNHDVILFHVM